MDFLEWRDTDCANETSDYIITKIMEPITQLVLLTAIAGAAIPIGGFLASIDHIRSRWLEEELRHTILAFGGGALISAVALVLIPKGVELIATWEAITAFGVG